MVPFGGLGSFGRLRSTSCTLRRSSGGFGSSSRYLLYPSAASGYLRRFFGGFGLPSENLLYPSVSPVRRTGGAGGLPLRQAPRGRCLASSWLKPRLNFGGVQAYRPLQSGEALLIVFCYNEIFREVHCRWCYIVSRDECVSLGIVRGD